MDGMIKTIKLKCEACGGEMTIEADKNVAICPFCGSSKLIIEDKDVLIEKIRNDGLKDTNKVRREELNLQREELKLKKEALKYQKAADAREANKIWHENFKKGKFSKFLIIFAIAVAITSLGGFTNCKYDLDYLPSSLFMVVQVALIIFALLIGYGTIQFKRFVFAIAVAASFGVGFLAMLFIP